MNQQTFRFVVRCPGCSVSLRYANSEILSSLLLRCPDCSHSFIAKCNGAKQDPKIESMPSRPSPLEVFLPNKPTSRPATLASRHSRSTGLWKAAILIGCALLLIGVIVPVIAVAMIAVSKNARNGISQNANIPKADFQNRVKPPKTATSIVPPSQKPNRSTYSKPQGSPSVDDKPISQQPRGNANAADGAAVPTPPFEPPNMSPPRMDPPRGGFDRPGVPRFGPNHPNGPPGFGPPPGMMFGPGGNSMPSSSADEMDTADGVRIFITNAKGLKTRDIVDKLKKDLDVSGHTARSSGNEMSIELRFSGPIQTIAERVDFGKIVELDQVNRVIRIEADDP